MRSLRSNLWQPVFPALKRMRRLLSTLVPALCVGTLTLAPLPAWADDASRSAMEEVGGVALRHFSIEQGLSQSEVTAMALDHEGFLWVGTQDGLNRYDGYSFHIFRNDPRVPGTLGGNHVRALVVDKAGDVWTVTTSPSLDKFDRQTSKFVPHLLPQDPEQRGEELIVSLVAYSRGGFLLTTSRDGLYHFDAETKTFRSLMPANLAENSPDRQKTMPAVHEDAQGQIWFTRDRDRLYRFADVKSQPIVFEADKPQPGGWMGGAVQKMISTKDQTLWLATSEGLFRRAPGTQYFERLHIPFPDTAVNRMRMPLRLLEDADGTVIVGTTDGVYGVNPKTLTFTPYPVNDENASSHRQINALYLAPDGEVWVGSSSHGLHRLDRAKKRLIQYADHTTAGSSSADGPITEILSDKAGNLWMAGSAGLWQGKRGRDTFFTLRNLPTVKNSLSHPMVWSVAEDSKGDVWVGTADGTLNRILASGEVRHYPAPGDDPVVKFRRTLLNAAEDGKGRLWFGRISGELSLFDRKLEAFVAPDSHFELKSGDVVKPVLCSTLEAQASIAAQGKGNPCAEKEAIFGLPGLKKVHIDQSGHVWLLTHDGLLRLDDNTNVFRRVKAKSGDFSLDGTAITSLTEDDQGRFWMAAGARLVRFDPASSTLHFPTLRPEVLRSLPVEQVLSLRYQKPETLWLGTFGRGLLRLDLKSGDVRLYTTADGLPNNTVYGLLEDRSGCLWMSTNQGLVRLDPRTHATRIFGADEGLQSDEFNEGPAAQGPSGHLYFGGIRGVTRFRPERVVQNPVPPPVSITAFRKFDTPEPMAQADGGSLQVELTHKDNYFTFEFTALDLTDPERNRYRYKLEGFDQNWHEVGNRRFASYTSLPGGDYLFRVQGANNDGVWNETGASVHLTVVPPPWKTWWAYTAYVLALVGTVFAVLRAQQRKLERERATNEQLRRVDRLKDEFLANTSHELRTPLNGIIGLAESLMDGATGALNKECLSNLSMIASSGRRLAHLINDILDFSKLKNHDLELSKKPVQLQPIAEVVLTLLKPLVGSKPVTLHNEISTELPAVLGDENRLQQILHNLLGNAIKFTDSGEVRIWAQVNGNKIEVTVADTGIGIPEDKRTDIFRSFEQVDGSISRRYGGTGLGLAISRQLVELHGGSIWVESTLGQGSRFVFELPVASATCTLPWNGRKREHEAQDSASEELALTALQRVHNDVVPEVVQLEFDDTVEHHYRILIVDDEPVNLQVLVNHLAPRHYHITLATGGAEALERVASVRLGKEPKFDLVILDVMMPGMSGFEVCRRIREHWLPSELPVVLLTARNQIADLVEGFNAGANDYLTKPVSKHELMVRTRMHLQLSKLNAAYSRFVPREFLEHLALDSILDVKLGDHVLKEMTVLFSDIRSFTSLSEQMSPEETFRFVNSYLERMEPAIREHGGFIDKYIGDAIMALFSDEAENALKAGIAMLVALEEYNQGRARAGYEAIHIGIGINTGNLMLGTVGGPQRMDGTVISDAVNLASRIEGLTKMYGACVLITDKTRERLRYPQQFSMRLVDRVKVKGRFEPVEIYEVFDGDPTELREGKLATLDMWHTGQRLYVQGDFCPAREAFQACLNLCPTDRAARLYVDRCEQSFTVETRNHWDGVTVMDHK